MDSIVTDSTERPHREANLNIVFIGIVIHGVLFGLLCGQIWWYLTHYYRRDRNHLRFLVLLVLCLSICHFGLFIFTIFRVLVTMHSVVIPSNQVPWSASAQVLINACGVLAVHVFYLSRIWSFGKKKLVTGLLGVLVLGSYTVGLFMFIEKYVNAYFVFYLYEPPPMTDNDFLEEIRNRLVADQFILNVVLAGTDICLTSTYVILLFRAQKGGAERSHRLVKKLVYYAVTSGALTCLCSILSLITIITLPRLTVSVLLSYTAANLYASAFVANLNIRDGLRERWAEVSSLDMPTLCDEPLPVGETLPSVPELPESGMMHPEVEAFPHPGLLPPMLPDIDVEVEFFSEKRDEFPTTGHIHFAGHDRRDGTAWASSDAGSGSARLNRASSLSTAGSGSTCAGSDASGKHCEV